MIVRRIEVLEPQLANKIAAGEVVERPASVVKELVENSLDAGASAVTVEIREGGTEYIRVTDNGSGIPSQDVETAFLRHATSKLHSVDGLDAIETFGFRGEALASIAAVSHVTMRTRTEDAECGTLISIDGGTVRECGPCGCPTGTTIELRELFYNVPARLKFLKSTRSEAAAVGDYVLRLILGNTDVSFKFINNGKPIYHSAGDGSLENALMCVYGSELADCIKPVYYDDGYILINGYCGDESISRSSRIQQSVYVNGRYIRSQQISLAVQRAYETRLMTGRFPFIVLNIKLSPREVDVNVHPNKLTVRFRDEERIASAVMIAVSDALAGRTELPVERTQTVDERPVTFDGVCEAFKNSRSESVIENHVLGAADSESETDTAELEPVKNYEEQMPQTDAAENASSSAESKPKKADAPSDNEELGYYSFINESKPAVEKTEPIAFGMERFTVIGAVFDTYIVVEQGDSVFYIDQHAAHERILYERLIRNELKFDSQLLLTPNVMTLSPAEFGCLMDNIERFRELGFDIEEFGPMSISVRAVPTGVGSEPIDRLVHDMIGIILRKGSVTELDVVRNELIQASCKNAIKAGNMLNDYEINEILSHYADGSTPLTCPHGRPIMLRFNKRDFEKMFKRII